MTYVTSSIHAFHMSHDLYFSAQMHQRNKRSPSIYEFLFGQSTADLARKTSSQFEKVNENFQNIAKSEEAIRKFFTVAQAKFDGLSKEEKNLHEISLMTRFFSQKNKDINFFFTELRLMKDALQHPTKLDLALKLLTNQRFCRGLMCYHSHMYRITREKVLHIDTIRESVSLRPQILLSCLLLDDNRTSIFHGEIFDLKDGKLFPKNPTLPRNLTLLDLHGTMVNKITRKITDKDLIKSTLFPVFNLDSIGFLCPTNQMLDIDGETVNCNLHSLQFHTFPKRITVNDEILWDTQEGVSSDYLQKRLKWSFQDLSPNLIDHEVYTTNIRNPHAFDSLTQYFQTADSVSITLWATVGSFLLIFTVGGIIICCFCYPRFALKCCSGKWNILRKCLETRLADLDLQNLGKDTKKEFDAKAERERYQMELLLNQKGGPHAAQGTTGQPKLNNVSGQYTVLSQQADQIQADQRQPSAPKIYLSASKEINNY